MGDMAIPQATVDEVMVKAGRRCCICRRFAPLHLQVHHIRERNKEGDDEFDNLIAVCLTCHSDAHTETSLTRRFSESEIKGLRDNTYSLVESGKLVEGDTDPDRLVALLAPLLDLVRDRGTTGPSVLPASSLSVEALDILSALASADDGLLSMNHTVRGYVMQAGSRHLLDRTDRRREAAYKNALRVLEETGLVELDNPSDGDHLYVLTHRGYLFVDQIAAASTNLP